MRTGGPAAEAVRAGPLRRPRLGRAAPAGLLLLTAAGYASSWPADFVWDDVTVVRDNPLVAAADLGAVFSTDYWGPNAHSGLYRPLATLTYGLNRALLGPQAAGFHAVNLVLHAAVAVAIYLLLRRLAFPGPRAWFAAAVFALHPVHAEVVNTVTGRTESLAALGVLAGLLAGVSAFRGRLAVAACCYAAALLCKESAVVFLALAPLVDAFRPERAPGLWRRRASWYLALLALTAAWFWLRHLVALGAPVGPDLIYPMDNPTVGLPPAARVLTVLKAQALYAGMLLLPARLQAVYSGKSLAAVASPSTPLVIGLVLAALLAAGLCAAAWRSRSAAGFGLLFYAASFAVTSNLLFPIAVLVAERHLYLPSVGFCAAVASLAPVGGTSAVPWRRATLSLLAVAYLAGLGALLLARNLDFRSGLRLAEVAVRHDPRNARAWFFLGSELSARGRPEEAERAHRRALSAEPSFPEPQAELARLLLERGRAEEAMELARRAVGATRGELPPAYFVLAQASIVLGRPAEALAWLAKAAPAADGQSLFWEVRGDALQGAGNLEEAAASYRRSLALGGSPRARLRLGELLLRQGRLEEGRATVREAESLLRDALALREDADALQLLGLALALQDRDAEARVYLEKALAIDPSAEAVRANYRRVLERLGAASP